MFIDEKFEDLLVNKHLEMALVIREIFADKLSDKAEMNLTTIKRVENGYQLFRKRFPEYLENAVRLYVAVLSPNIAKSLGWNEG